MGADIATDLRKSFAMATGGPPSMQGREVKPGSVITSDYTEAEEREARGRRDAKKRQSSSNPPKQTHKQTSGDAKKNHRGSKGGRRGGDKPRRRNYWEDEVHLTSVHVPCYLRANSVRTIVKALSKGITTRRYPLIPSVLYSLSDTSSWLISNLHRMTTATPLGKTPSPRQGRTMMMIVSTIERIRSTIR